VTLRGTPDPCLLCPSSVGILQWVFGQKFTRARAQPEKTSFADYDKFLECIHQFGFSGSEEDLPLDILAGVVQAAQTDKNVVSSFADGDLVFEIELSRLRPVQRPL
jgi:hypothetical protein